MTSQTTDTQTGILVRDFQELADTLIAQNAAVASIFSTGPAATAIKHEWADDAPLLDRDTLAVSVVPADTVLTVGDADNFEVGVTITIETPAGVATLEQMRVTAVNTVTNQITVVRAFAGVAGSYAIGDIVKIISRPRAENEKNFAATGTVPTTHFNVLQIFRRTVEASRTLQNVGKYATGQDSLDYQRQLRSLEMVRELNRALIWGVRTESGVDGLRRMGGLFHYGTKTTLGAALTSPSQINDVSAQMLVDGVTATDIIASPDIARKISGFNTGTLQTVLSDRETGSHVTRFVGDTALSGIQNIVVDTDWPRNFFALVDRTRLSLHYIETMNSVDSTTPGQHGMSETMRMELTAQFKNGSKAVRVVTGVTL